MNLIYCIGVSLLSSQLVFSGFGTVYFVHRVSVNNVLGIGHFEQAVKDCIDLNDSGDRLTLCLHIQKQCINVGGGYVWHFQITQRGINPMVKIALVGGAPILRHGNGFGGHERTLTILTQCLDFCGLLFYLEVAFFLLFPADNLAGLDLALKFGCYSGKLLVYGLLTKLQSKIDALSLDDSRKAQAEKMSLEEELAELQKELADFQADHAMDVTEETLDKQYDAYEQEKDAEIEKLEESISSTQKLYDMAIKYIKENWNTLYQELLDWNYEYGNNLNSEITAAWEAAQEAASKYGDFVTAIMGGIENDIASITAQIQSLTAQISNLSTTTSGGGGIGSVPNIVGKIDTDTTYSEDDMKQAKQKAVSDVVSQMRALSSQWHTADKATQKQLSDRALQLGATLASYGVVAHRDEPTGAWYIDNDLLNPSNVGKLLYNCYHTGGFVGEEPLKPNEKYIKAKDGELVLTSDQQDGFAAEVDSFKTMTDAFSGLVVDMPVTPQSLWSDSALASGNSVSNITTNNSPVEINFGDTTINCVPEKSVEAHQKISRDMLNEIARQFRKP